MLAKLYILSRDYSQAIIKINNQNFELFGPDNIIPYFHGDLVEFDINSNKIIKPIKSNLNKNIIGILELNTKYKYGFNKKNHQIYRVRPLNSRYPYFMVNSSTNSKINQYILFEFIKWDKYPMGKIIRFLGDTGDINNTYEAIIYKYNLSTIKPKYNSTININGFNPINIQNNHLDISDKYIFSVDPESCQDIDDALSLDILPNNNYLIGIHISDVSTFFDYFKFDLKLFSTIYAPHKIYNMIPDIFANNFCSLKPNNSRLAISLFMEINQAGQILNFNFKKTIIISKKSYNYQELQDLINNNPDKIPLEKKLFDIGKILYKQDNYDTHKMVEIYMVLANNLAAKYLSKLYPDKTIYRAHKKKNSDIKLSGIPELDNILNILESNSAYYTKNPENIYHAGLDLDYYTHFTSPIRRFVDIYIHKLIKSELNIDINPDQINKFNKNLKKITREFNKINIATNLNSDKIIQGYILDFKLNKLLLYLPEYKIIHNTRLFDNKLKNIIKTNITEDFAEYIYQDKNIKFIKYQKIDIKLIPKIYMDDIHKKIQTKIILFEDIFNNI